MLDDFREWLSDNLRYFELGGAILLLLLLIVFGVRACTKGKTDTPKETKKQQETVQETPGDEETQEVKAEKKEVKEQSNKLEEAPEDVRKLIEDYYAALSAKDLNALQTLVEDFAAEDENRIQNTFIDNYRVKDVYTKPGLQDDAYAVFAEYVYYCPGFEPGVPGLSQFYVETGDDGNLIINSKADSDTIISAYTTKIAKDDDVVSLYERVNTDHNKTLQENPELNDYLNGQGQSGDGQFEPQVQAGPTLVANDDCYVRDAPHGEVIGGVSRGTRVEKKGEDEGWIRIDYQGTTGYIYGELLDEE
ncbi:MAG: SH3 domain-containing protein [Clostridiales bacterium]|nr:SH3 domain-containing protein [Candidatus Blautia equi]